MSSPPPSTPAPKPAAVTVGHVLASRDFRRWSAPVALARMPSSMAAVVLTTAAAHYLGDPARGGPLATTFAVAFLLLAPSNAARADRIGAARVLRLQLSASAACWLVLAVLADAGAPLWSWYLPVAGAGLSLSGISAVLRSTLSAAVGAGAVRVASSLDASAVDLVVVVAPLLVSAADLAGAFAAVAVAGVVSALGALAITTLPSTSVPPAGAMALGDQAAAPSPGGGGRARERLPRPSRTRPWARRWARQPRALVAWEGAALALGAVVGCLEVGAVSLVTSHGATPTGAWVIFAVLSGASVLGGLVDARTATWGQCDHRPRLAVLTILTVAGAVLVATATPWALTLVGVALVGLPSSSLLSAMARRSEALSPGSASARGLAVVYALFSLGYAAAGLLLALGVHTAALAAGVAVLAALLAVIATDRPHEV